MMMFRPQSLACYPQVKWGTPRDWYNPRCTLATSVGNAVIPFEEFVAVRHLSFCVSIFYYFHLTAGGE